LVKLAKEIFDQHMPQPNQLYLRRDDVVTAKDLISTAGFEKGAITEKGLRMNVNVALQYMDAWLNGNGCVPIHNLMEDAATAEISRSQIWQWVRHSAKTKEGKTINAAFVSQILDEETLKLKSVSKSTKLELAKKYLAGTVLGKEYADFLTTLLYDSIATVSAKL
jgi:malate synthase